MTVMIEAVLYTRVSSDKQIDGVSLDVQLRECRQYAARHGFALGNEYQDILSGKRDDRPAYQAMLADIRAASANGRRVVVVCWRLDRFGRRVLERVRAREELKRLGASVHSATEGGEVSDITANILAAVAEEEVRVLVERVKGARRAVRESGWRPIGKLPTGYTLRDATAQERAAGAPRRVLTVDPVTAPTIRAAFERVVTGAGIRTTARWLGALPHAERGGLVWSPQTLRDALHSSVYVARNEPTDGHDVLAQPVGRWEPIISDDLYARVQAALALHRTLPQQASGRYLLSGFARCPRCDGRMVGRRQTTQRDRYACDAGHATATASNLDASVIGQIVPILARVATRNGPLRRALQAEWDRLRGAGAHRLDAQRVARLRATLEQGRRRLADAAVLLVDGALDRAGYDAARERIEADVRAAQAELDRVESAAGALHALPTLDVALAKLGGWATALTDDAQVDGRRRVLAELVARVEPVRVGHGQYDGRITWTPLGEALRQVAGALGVAA